ncbi:hypothetical protein KKG52_01085 [Patescibacteria group bacterium]|nr:hypothetical protein [Patescibacteria group bacterium]
MRKRKKNNKRKKSRLRKKLLLVFLFLLIFLSSILFVFMGFVINNKFIISPVTRQQVEKKITLEQELKKQKIEYSEIRILQDYYIIEIKDNGVALISQNKAIKKQVASLQLIINRLTIEGKRFKKLDFRYDKPLISF